MEEGFEISIGYILLIIFLALGLIIFMLLWILSLNNTNNTTNTCFGSFGVQTNTDAQPLNICGTSGTNTCVFSKSTLADAQSQCDILRSICNSFTFNELTSTMRIVEPSTRFNSLSSSLYVRQT